VILLEGLLIIERNNPTRNTTEKGLRGGKNLGSLELRVMNQKNRQRYLKADRLERCWETKTFLIHTEMNTSHARTGGLIVHTNVKCANHRSKTKDHCVTGQTGQGSCLRSLWTELTQMEPAVH